MTRVARSRWSGVFSLDVGSWDWGQVDAICMSSCSRSSKLLVVQQQQQNGVDHYSRPICRVGNNKMPSSGERASECNGNEDILFISSFIMAKQPPACLLSYKI
jgi:hypothetical protein